jgi:hypothetical protein
MLDYIYTMLTDEEEYVQMSNNMPRTYGSGADGEYVPLSELGVTQELSTFTYLWNEGASVVW